MAPRQSDGFRDVAYDRAVRLASHPDVVADLETLGVDVPAYVAAHERELGESLRQDTGRTYNAPVRVDRTIYDRMAGRAVTTHGGQGMNPVGRPESARGRVLEARAMAAAARDARKARR